MLKRLLVLSLLGILSASPLYAKFVGKKFKEITAEKPFYLNRSGKNWGKGGRVIGEIKNTVDSFKILFRKSGSSKIYYTYVHPAALTVFMTKILPPGRYDLEIIADGYSHYRIPGIKIFMKKDCVIKLRFGKRVFVNN